MSENDRSQEIGSELRELQEQIVGQNQTISSGIKMELRDGLIYERAVQELPNEYDNGLSRRWAWGLGTSLSEPFIPESDNRSFLGNLWHNASSGLAWRAEKLLDRVMMLVGTDAYCNANAPQNKNRTVDRIQDASEGPQMDGPNTPGID